MAENDKQNVAKAKAAVAAKKPVVQKPVVQKPIVQKPVVEKPVVEKTNDKISLFKTSTTTTNGVPSITKTEVDAPGKAWVKGKGKNKNFWVKPTAPAGADVAWDDNAGWISRNSGTSANSTQLGDYSLTLAVINSDSSLTAIFNEAWASQQSGQEWTQEKFITKIRSSDWYTSRSQAQRDYYVLANDPAQAEELKRQIEEKKSSLSYSAKVNGINITDEQLNLLSRSSLEFGYNETQMTSLMADYINYTDNGIDSVIGSLTGKTGEIENDIRGWAKKNGVTVSDSWVIGQIKNSAKSGWDIGAATDYITNIAKQEFSGWADKLDSNTSIEDLASGVKQMYSNEMDIDFSTLDMTNSFVRNAMLAKDDKGQPLTSDTHRKDLYKTDEWSDVIKNKNKIISTGRDVLTRMGF